MSKRRISFHQLVQLNKELIKSDSEAIKRIEEKIDKKHVFESNEKVELLSRG